MTRLWEKGLPLAQRVLRYTAGEDHVLDSRLVAYDIKGSIAHAEMLCAQTLLNQEDCDAICAGLEQLGEGHKNGDWQIRLEDEDAHTAIENRLIDRGVAQEAASSVLLHCDGINGGLEKLADAFL